MTPTPVWAGGGYAQSYAGGMVSPRAHTPESPRNNDLYYSPASTMASGRTSPRYMPHASPYGGPASPRTAGLGYTSSGASNSGRPLGRPTSGGGVRTPTYSSAGGYTSRYAGGAAGSMMVSSPTAGGSLTPLGSRRSTSPRHPTSDVGSLIASAAYKATSPRAGAGPSNMYYPDSPSAVQPLRSTASGRGYAAGNRSPGHDRSAGNLIAGHAMNVVPNPRRNSHPGHQEYR